MSIDFTLPIGFDKAPKRYMKYSQQDGVETTPADSASTDQAYEPDEVVDYSEMIAESAFLGEMPFATIISGIREQFSDYIGTEDTTNYVQIFYDEWSESYQTVINDDAEDHPMEIKEALDKIKDEFVDIIMDLFESRLTISISVIDDVTTEEDEVEIVIRKIYEYFILNAKDNFKTVISKDIVPKLGIIVDDNVYYARIEELLRGYDPLVTCMTPTEFIDYTGDEDIIELFESGQISGNFLRKYTAKLYQNEDFKNDVITEITVFQNLKEDILNG